MPRIARAQVDMNVVMTLERNGEKGFVEVQGTGEGRAYTRGELNALLDLAEDGIEKLMEKQRSALGEKAYRHRQKAPAGAGQRQF